MSQPITQYSSVVPMFQALPSWVPPLDQQRIASYSAYDDIYWNSGDVFKILMRGGEAEEDVIYVPTARTIVETINRYVGVGLNFSILESSGSPATQEEAKSAFSALFAREAFLSRYNSGKRFGMVRGDWGWHVFADPTKPEGSRLSIVSIDPRTYFPVFESDVIPGGRPDKIIRAFLVDMIEEDEELFIRRQRYEKVTEGGVTTIWTEVAVFKPDEWFDSTKVPVRVEIPLTALPPEITAIPIYHIRNFDEPGNPFGSSELRGFERIMAAVNQGFTDEDLTLALEGLGVYATSNAARPVDSDGQAVDWSFAPGRVLQNAGDIRKISGVTSVTPYGDHIDRMVNSIKEASGANDAAIGKVDVQIAESGVALLLHLAPVLAKADEKDRIILDVHRQLFHDLRAWFKVYEGINIDDVTVVPVLGDKLPKNHKSIIEMAVALMSTSPPLLSAVSARMWLADQGLPIFAKNEAELVRLEQAEVASRADLFGARMGGELDPGSIGSETDPGGSEGGQ